MWAFPDDHWNSILKAFTTAVAGNPSSSKLCLNILAKSNPVHFSAYGMASRQITTIHCFSQMPTQMGQPKTRWDDHNFATDMDWTDMGVRSVELLPSLFYWATPNLVPVLVEEVLQYFANNPHADSMPVLPAAQAISRTKTVTVRLCTYLCATLTSSLLSSREEVTKGCATTICVSPGTAGSPPGMQALVEWKHTSLVQTLTQSY